MKQIPLILFFTLILTSFSANAGDDVRLNGEVEYHAPNTMSPAEARERAIEHARIELLRKEFGVAIGSQNILVDKTENTNTETKAFSLSETDTNGEWIKDLDDPEIISETPDKYGRTYRIKVNGLARKIEHQPIDIDVRFLCNGCDKNRDLIRNNTYYEGDNFYVYFNSPVGGWLTIYLCDDDPDMTMQAILPYDGQREKAYRIEPDKEYVFFSRDHAEPQYSDFAGGLKMYARKAIDVNVVYIIFSPNEFSRSSTNYNSTAEISTRVGNENINLMPRETDFKHFNKWLGKSRKKDPQMQVRKQIISVQKPR